MDSDSVRGIERRRVLAWGGVAAAGVVAAGASPARAAVAPVGPARTDPSGADRIPPDTRPGGTYDRYVAELAAAGRFSGVVMLSHRGRTVLSRCYGMADRERGIRNHEGTAFSLSSAGKPFGAVAILQLAQQGRLTLSDTVGTHLKGFARGIADGVTIHHLLAGLSGLRGPDEEIRRVFRSRQEVRAFCRQWALRATQVAPPGTATDHEGAEVAIPALIVEAVTGRTYWDYVEENIFARCGMTRSGFYTRPRWLTDRHVAHPYMALADGGEVDAIRHLDLSSPDPAVLGKNPGRAFIDAPGDGGFATAPDLVRFAHALGDGTVLDRPYADVLTSAKIPLGPDGFSAYTIPMSIVGGQWVLGRAGGNPGVAANWNVYPYTGWVGVVLGNGDSTPLQEMSERETQAVTGASPGPGGGG